MPVPFFDLRAPTLALRDELLRGLGDVLDTQGFANGPAVAVFEKQLADYLGVRHVIGVNNGTSALHAALICAGVQPGDEVITVAHTWISTAWAVSYIGGGLVFVDIDRRTAGLDPSLLEQAITPRTRAILPVHLYGSPVDLKPILQIASAAGVPVIEDCAQSIGATYDGRQTGSFGLVNATSFYPSKNLGGCGEAGAVMTNDDSIAERARRLRDHAQSSRHNHVEVGFNWRMDGFQGAVLSVKLRQLDDWNARRRTVAGRYISAMQDIAGLTLLSTLPAAVPVWHIFPVFHPRRDELRALLDSRGIQTGVHYPRPVHLQPVYQPLGVPEGRLPVSEWMAATEVSLPMFPELSDQQIDEVIDAVRWACRQLGS